jgi:hypothetical protein
MDSVEAAGWRHAGKRNGSGRDFRRGSSFFLQGTISRRESKKGLKKG